MLKDVKYIKTALVAAGVSWTAFVAIATYAIESWLADMKLKAGRLGVMNALGNLKDSTYYADIESTGIQTDIPTPVSNETNLLKKLTNKAVN